jgi:exopolyphosphatase/guanosine-5'-triphosphate,3'-diphosphate pyrophosphatase
MRYTVVDIGSNTMRMSVYDDRNGTMRHIMSEKELIGLIGYTADGVLSDEGILRVTETLHDFKETSDAIGSDVFSAFATAGLRNIKNTQHAADIIRERTGVSVSIISGEEEARLDFVGAYKGVNLDCGLMVDMGGGSTELVRFCGAHIENSVSLPFGSLYLYKNFVREILPNDGELKKIGTFVSEQLESIEWLTGIGDNLCLIGGTSRAAARLRQEFFDHKQSELQGFSFDANDISSLLKQIKGSKRKSSRVITRVTPERLHTILPGLCAFSRIIKRAGCKTITISRNGVREGYLHEYVLGGAAK